MGCLGRGGTSSAKKECRRGPGHGLLTRDCPTGNPSDGVRVDIVGAMTTRVHSRLGMRLKQFLLARKLPQTATNQVSNNPILSKGVLVENEKQKRVERTGLGTNMQHQLGLMVVRGDDDDSS